MKLKEIMSKNIVRIKKEETVYTAAKIMDDKSIGCLLVEENGVITERDILKTIAKGKDPSKTLVKEVMSQNIVKADANTDLEEAAAILEKNKIRRLVITENNKIAGIITIRDINKNMMYLLARRIVKGYEHTDRPNYGKP